MINPKLSPTQNALKDMIACRKEAVTAARDRYKQILADCKHEVIETIDTCAKCLICDKFISDLYCPLSPTLSCIYDDTDICVYCQGKKNE